MADTADPRPSSSTAPAYDTADADNKPVDTMVPIPVATVPGGQRTADANIGGVRPRSESMVTAAMRRGFTRLGYLVADYAWLTVALLSVLVPLSALGMLRFRVDNDVRFDFALAGQRSIQEGRALAEFYGKNGYLYYFNAQLYARDGGNLLRPAHRAAALAIYRHVQSEVTVPVVVRDERVHNTVAGLFSRNDSTTVKYQSYQDLCSFTCDLNKPAITLLKIYQYGGNNNSPKIRAGYPNMKLFSHDVYVANNVYDVKTKDGIIESVGILNFVAATTIPRSRIDTLNAWERAAAGYMQAVHNNGSHLIDAVHGGHHMTSVAMDHVAKATIPKLPIGFTLTLIFTILTSLNWTRGADPRDSKPWTAAIGLFTPLMAIAVSMCTLFACGMPFKAMQATSPFLIMAIGVDDVFIAVRSWCRVDKRLPARERIARTMGDAGPTITLTSLTNAISMLCGQLNATPAIQAFCRFTAFGVAVNYVYQILFFTAVLYLSARWEHRRSFPRACDPERAVDYLRDAADRRNSTKPAPPIAGADSRWLLAYCRFVCTRWARLLALVVLAAYYTGASVGMTALKADMSQDKVMPRDSLLLRFTRFQYEFEYVEGRTITVLVNNPGDLEDVNRLESLLRMADAFETAENSMGRQSTQLWLRDYFTYLSFRNRQFDDGVQFVYRYLPAFIQVPQYRRWRYTFHMAPALCTDTADDDSPNRTDIAANGCLQAFVFQTGFRNATDWPTRVRLLENWRRIADAHPQFNVTVYEDLGVYADQVSLMGEMTATSVAVAMFAMLLVCVVFFASFWPVVAAVSALASIVYGIVGYMALFGFDLDIITAAAVIVLIGYSVDFAAHVPYHYYKDKESKTTALRLYQALVSIGGPMVQAGITTALAVTGLYFVHSYCTDVFVFLQPFTVVLGMMHGLLILPVFLATLNPVKEKG